MKIFQDFKIMNNSSLDAEKKVIRCHKIPFQKVNIILSHSQGIISKVNCSEKNRCSLENLDEDNQWRCLYQDLSLKYLEIIKKIKSDIPLMQDLTRCRSCGNLIILSNDYSENKRRKNKYHELIQFYSAVPINLKLNEKEKNTLFCIDCSTQLEKYLQDWF